jgi:uncharacterized protein
MTPGPWFATAACPRVSGAGPTCPTWQRPVLCWTGQLNREGPRVVNDDPRDNASPPDSLAALLEKAAAMSRGTPGSQAPRDDRSPSVHRPPPPDPAAEAALAASLADIVHRVARQSRQENSAADEVAAVTRPVSSVAASLAVDDPGAASSPPSPSPSPSPSSVPSPWASASAPPSPERRAAATVIPPTGVPASAATTAAPKRKARPEPRPPPRARQAAVAAGLLGATALAWWAVAGWMMDPPVLPADQRIAAVPAQPPALPPALPAEPPSTGTVSGSMPGSAGESPADLVAPEPSLPPVAAPVPDAVPLPAAPAPPVPAASAGAAPPILSPAPAPAPMPPAMPAPQAEPLLAVAAAPAQAQRWAEVAGTLGVVSERDVGPEPGLLASWGSRVATGSGTPLAPITSDGWAESLQALHAQPRVSAVRYEALQAAGRSAPAGGWPALQVVAPLALDAVYFVVRTDSPLQYIHQIRGRAINIGPPQGSRALTAQTLYRRLFGGALPRSPLAALDQRSALARLGQDHTLDVVLAVGSSARAWLAGLSAEDAGAYRLLGLDERQASTRRAVQAFLPATVRAGSLGHFPLAETSTLGVMSFLVTARPHGEHAAAHDGAIAALAGAVCRTTHTRPPEVTVGWQRVPPDLEPEVGWPYSPAARRALAGCGRPGIPPALPAGSTPKT